MAALIARRTAVQTAAPCARIAVRGYFSAGSAAHPPRAPPRPSIGDGPLYSAWSVTGSPLAAELLANLYDVVVIDNQHGIGDPARMLAALSASPKPPIAVMRVSRLDDAEIGKALDAGAHALICPMINSAAEAQAFVRASLYPPDGHRSFGPHRAILGHIASPAGTLGEWVRTQNRSVQLLAMVETAGAMANLDEILQVPGLSGVYIGPNDLSMALGAEPSSAPQGEMLERIAFVCERAHAHGRLAGIFCADPRTGRKMAEMGFDVVNVGSDIGFLAEGGRAALEQVVQKD
jgi:4-hydroxy-2-oxoheptanedioate aldolase